MRFTSNGIWLLQKNVLSISYMHISLSVLQDYTPGLFNFPFFPAFGGGMEEGARAPRAPVRGYRP
jgi:hypothetical protein